MTSFPITCDVCRELVHEPWRSRHRDCPPPRLPDAFHTARERVRNMPLNAKRIRRAAD